MLNKWAQGCICILHLRYLSDIRSMRCIPTSGWIFVEPASMDHRNQSPQTAALVSQASLYIFIILTRLPSGVSGLQSSKSKYRCIREKSFLMGLGVTGTGRVSGAPTEWEVYVHPLPSLFPHSPSYPSAHLITSHRNYTYTFSPITGLIHLHTIDSIEPAPHAALFEAMGRFGLVGGGSERNAGSGGVGGMVPTGCGGRGRS